MRRTVDFDRSIAVTTSARLSCTTQHYHFTAGTTIMKPLLFWTPWCHSGKQISAETFIWIGWHDIIL